jgi:hypothetical protein
MSGLESVDKEINQLNADLEGVLFELNELRRRKEKNAKAKADALQFIEKAEKVIIMAERGEIQITSEQRSTIQAALLKIQKLFSQG